ncbi:hypothetical protein HDU98_007983 [Podochytrium sp. JEL0797]|nr:hypothetical protein HDU98_007983 [Podochytrium sp. JEL0797]
MLDIHVAQVHFLNHLYAIKSRMLSDGVFLLIRAGDREFQTQVKPMTTFVDFDEKFTGVSDVTEIVFEIREVKHNKTNVLLGQKSVELGQLQSEQFQKVTVALGSYARCEIRTRVSHVVAPPTVLAPAPPKLQHQVLDTVDASPVREIPSVTRNFATIAFDPTEPDPDCESISSSDSNVDAKSIISLQSNDPLLNLYEDELQALAKRDQKGTDEGMFWTTPTPRDVNLEQLKDLLKSPHFWLVHSDGKGALQLVKPSTNAKLRDLIASVGYRCVSHVWGDARGTWSSHGVKSFDGISAIPWKVKMLEGKRSRILNLLHSSGAGYWWCDVFCQDQSSNNPEQFQIMGKVYSCCEECVALIDVRAEAIQKLKSNMSSLTPMLRYLALRTREDLSEGITGSHRGDLSLIEMLSGIAASMPNDSDWKELLKTAACRHGSEADFTHGLTAVLESSWFQRVWTLQEAVCPRKVVLISDRNSLGSQAARVPECEVDLTVIVKVAQALHLWTVPIIYSADYDLKTSNRVGGSDNVYSNSVDLISKVTSHLRQMQRVAREVTLISKMQTLLKARDLTGNIREIVLQSLAVSRRSCTQHQDYFYGVMGLLDIEIELGLKQHDALKAFLTSLKERGIPIVSPYVGKEGTDESWVGLENWDSMAGVFNRWRQVNTSIEMFGFETQFNGDQVAITGDVVTMRATSKLLILKEHRREADPRLVRHCRAMLHGAKINQIFGRNLVNLDRCVDSLEQHVMQASGPIRLLAQHSGNKYAGELVLKHNGPSNGRGVVKQSGANIVGQDELTTQDMFSKFSLDILASIDPVDHKMVSYEVCLEDASGTHDSFEIEAKLFPRMLMFYLHRWYVKYDSFGDELPFDIKEGMEIAHLVGNTSMGLLICSDPFNYKLHKDMEFIIGTEKAANKTDASRLYSSRHLLKRLIDEGNGMLKLHVAAVKVDNHSKLVGSLLAFELERIALIEGATVNDKFVNDHYSNAIRHEA